MPDSTVPPPSDASPHATAFRRRLRFLLAVALGLMCIAAGYAAWVHDKSDPRHDNPAPLHRVGTNAPFIVTPPSVVAKIVEFAELSSDDMVYDLGCGDGRLVIAAAVDSGCRGIGFDIDPERVAEAKENAKQQGVQEEVQIIEQDVFTVDLREADVVVMYLLPWMLKKLIPQFDEMRPGTKIISHDFFIPGCKPDRTEKVYLDPEGVREFQYVHLWITPLRKGSLPE